MNRGRSAVAILSSLLLAGLTAAAGGGGGASGAASRDEAAARPAPKVLLKNFRFVGLDADLVGKGMGEPGARPRDPRRNGDRDGHFSALLVTKTAGLTLRLVMLQVPVKGHRLGPPVWGTLPMKRAPILGVSLRGKRLNPNDDQINVRLPRSSKGLRLDVYANDDGQFLPGRRFRLLVGTRQEPVAVTKLLTIPGRRATMTAGFAGRGEDRVGYLAVNGVGPDGIPDAHFTARLDTHGAWRIITHVVLQHVDAQGRGIGRAGDEYCRPDGSKEIAANGWSAGCLLLLVDGRPIGLTPDWGQGPEGPGYKPGEERPFPRCPPRGDPPKPKSPGTSCLLYVPLRPSRRPARLDVYVNDPDPGLAVAGERFRLTVYFSDYVFGTLYGLPGTASATVRIA